jgi:hypothetical protein
MSRRQRARSRYKRQRGGSASAKQITTRQTMIRHVSSFIQSPNHVPATPPVAFKNVRRVQS